MRGWGGPAGVLLLSPAGVLLLLTRALAAAAGSGGESTRHAAHTPPRSWFGLETSDFALHGLWCVNWISTLDFVAANAFNCLRVPFSAELALDLDGKRPGNIDASANPDLAGLTTGQVLDR